MYPVFPEFYPRVEGFFTSSQPGNAMARSVLENRCPGSVWVDHLERPTTALIAVDHSFLIPGRSIHPAFLNRVVSQLGRHRRLHLVWTDDQKRKLNPPPGRKQTIKRREFRNRDRSVHFPSSPSDPIRVCKITSDLLPQCQWTHEMERIFGGLRRFFMHGLGFCLIRDNEILAEAYAAFWGNGQVEIAVITDQDHRHQGLGCRVSIELIEACEAMGFDTHWNCDSRNRASMKLAANLGYRSQARYLLLEYPAVRSSRSSPFDGFASLEPARREQQV
jgi:RimJ/RimL family protein N-acetyltransferase